MILFGLIHGELLFNYFQIAGLCCRDRVPDCIWDPKASTVGTWQSKIDRCFLQEQLLAYLLFSFCLSCKARLLDLPHQCPLLWTQFFKCFRVSIYSFWRQPSLPSLITVAVHHQLRPHPLILSGRLRILSLPGKWLLLVFFFRQPEPSILLHMGPLIKLASRALPSLGWFFFSKGPRGIINERLAGAGQAFYSDEIFTGICY